jgi:ubiquinone/menaquinone biosynthesis C-methylase UbiE
VFDRAAPTYDAVAGAYHDHFGERLVELAGIGRGDAVLDVACGRGAVLVPAARRAGRDGRVVGVDLSPSMVQLAAARAAAEGVDVDVRTGDAEDLGVEDGSFDAVLCAFGVFFFPDPERAVAGFGRALATGGVVALSTWGAEDERWAWEDELLADVDVARRAVTRPFDDVASLEQLLGGAGFADVEVRTEQHEVRLADADEWWAWKWSYSLRGVLEQLPPERLQRLRDEAVVRLDDLDDGHGMPLRLEALVALGRR